MNRKRILVILILVLFIIAFALRLFPSSEEKNSCLELAENLDKQSLSKISIGERCASWEDKQSSLWMGGRLINISFKENYNYYDYSLVFNGVNRQINFIVRTNSSYIPYEIGNFYKFDLNRQCRLSYLSTFSGFFYDPNLNALISLNCEA